MGDVAEIQGEVAAPKKKRSNGRAVATVEAAPAPVSQGDAFTALFERLARDPSVDPARIQQFLQMKREEEDRHARRAYLAALAEMQPKLPVIGKHGTINKNEKDERGNKTGSQVAMTKYAKWEDVVEGITPALAEHGFSLSFRVAQPTPDRIVVSGVLGHREGHTEETSISLPIDSTGAKNNVQGWGSSVSYGKRYTAFALLNISARGEDDDGKAAGTDGFITEQQADGIRTELDELGADVQKFCEALGVEALAKIPTSKIEAAKVIIGMKRKALKR
jgi:hypothetical protein